MESPLSWEHQDLVDELSQGQELARKLQIHLNVASSPQEAREFLAHKILISYEKALGILKWKGPLGMFDQQPNTVAKIRYSDSPGSFSVSPKSEDSDRYFKDLEVGTKSKKRKSMPWWTRQVQVCPGTGIEGQFNDGYSWRKYGQKDILGAKYPRGYYRCTHRHVQGCLATKQVQRSDEDATIFEINYRGSHTCVHVPQRTFHPPGKVEPYTTFQFQQQMTQPHQIQSQEILLNFQTSLKVITEDLHTDNKFISMENQLILPPNEENKFLKNCFSPSFTSPATSSSSYYSVPPCQMAGFGEGCNLNGLESELLDYLSVPSSDDNCPIVGLESPFGPIDQFEPSFSFDSPSLFSNF